MINKSEELDDPSLAVLKPGSCVNECKFVHPRSYLQNYKMVFDSSVPKEQWPVIATLTH